MNISLRASVILWPTGEPCIDMVFAPRQIQESREQNKGLFITYVDLIKAFGTVSRNGV